MQSWDNTFICHNAENMHYAFRTTLVRAVVQALWRGTATPRGTQRRKLGYGDPRPARCVMYYITILPRGVPAPVDPAKAALRHRALRAAGEIALSLG